MASSPSARDPDMVTALMTWPLRARPIGAGASDRAAEPAARIAPEPDTASGASATDPAAGIVTLAGPAAPGPASSIDPVPEKLCPAPARPGVPGDIDPVPVTVTAASPAMAGGGVARPPAAVMATA